MSQGSHTAYMVDIPNTNEKFVENFWKKYLKSYGGKSKKNRGSQEIYTSSAKISALFIPDFRLQAIHPEPVPISKIRRDSEVFSLMIIFFITHFL